MAESQLRKGAIELIVFGLLESRPSYGGELLDRLRQEAGVEVSSGTVYPLLSRLRKAGLVTTSWEESPAGPPRKIYELTTSGRQRLTELNDEWDVLTSAVAKVTHRKEQQ
ncbi:PadR family transcriptional regulator [Corynebacterium sp. TAE3-ERU12]|uniref:PadR family transcriptional regulator n=1 Tax=Corynebacterium sp. TAE3-ERU12 TaxID=2849491 RepID=UPI001C449160|nr:PadR family transcriptional regulator [Corynebacterium sp. TAE3-ERU12]MBV7294961.1 PadR family transcriptional regulator [Corynebacterium sp. TAE3-ERU12]